MEQYMSKTRGDYGSGITRPKIDGNVNFELKGQFLKELRDNTFSSLEHEDANETQNKRGEVKKIRMEELNPCINKVSEIVCLFHNPNKTQEQIMLRAFPEVILFYNGLDVPTRQILDSKGVIPSKTATDAKVAIQKMAELNSTVSGEIKKVNEKVYAAQVACELCKGPHYIKDSPLKEEGKTLKERYFYSIIYPK
ncbi:hypothetical protein Tco_0745076 [Tanacetum coccineum]